MDVKFFTIFFLVEYTPTKGVKYFYHFRKDFINPYGLANNLDSFTNTKLAPHLKRFNCEFLVRLTIALTEFANTILKNANYITRNL